MRIITFSVLREHQTSSVNMNNLASTTLVTNDMLECKEVLETQHTPAPTLLEKYQRDKAERLLCTLMPKCTTLCQQTFAMVYPTAISPHDKVRLFMNDETLLKALFWEDVPGKLPSAFVRMELTNRCRDIIGDIEPLQKDSHATDISDVVCQLKAMLETCCRLLCQKRPTLEAAKKMPQMETVFKQAVLCGYFDYDDKKVLRQIDTEVSKTDILTRYLKSLDASPTAHKGTFVASELTACATEYQESCVEKDTAKKEAMPPTKAPQVARKKRAAKPPRTPRAKKPRQQGKSLATTTLTATPVQPENVGAVSTTSTEDQDTTRTMTELHDIVSRVEAEINNDVPAPVYMHDIDAFDPCNPSLVYNNGSQPNPVCDDFSDGLYIDQFNWY